MQRLVFLIAFLPFLSANLSAKELAVVTAETGYLLNDAGRVVETVSLFESLDIESIDGEFLAVRRGEQSLRIHSGLVHQISKISDASDESLEGLQKVFHLLNEANVLVSNESYRAASEKAGAAAAAARGTFGEASTWEMWALQYQAFVLLEGEVNDDAAKILNSCVSLMEELAAEDHVHAADVFSTIGIQKQAEGDIEAAIEAHRRALLIALNHLGLKHHDTAIFQINEAYAHEAAGDLLHAAHLQKLALLTFDKILPPEAVAFAESWQRLGQFKRDNGDHNDAIASFEKAAQLYREHHPELFVELANVNTDLIYSHSELQNYPVAEAVCLANMELASRMEADDKRYYKRDALLRQGTLDFDRQDFEAALEHYEAARDVRARGETEFDDAVVVEAIGDSYLELGSISNAVSAYENAIGFFVETAGTESDEVLTLRDHLYSHADIPYTASDAYCIAALPEAFLLDDDGDTIATIPGLTVLKLLGTGDDYVTVTFEGQQGFVANSNVHVQRNIPGFGVGRRDTTTRIMELAGRALVKLEEEDVTAAEDAIVRAIDTSEVAYRTDSSLSLWLKVMEAGIHMRTRGADQAQQKLEAVRTAIEALNPESYPLFVEFTQAEAALLTEREQHKEAAALLTPILSRTKENYGENHAMVRSLERHIGINLYQAGQQDEAVTHLRAAMQMARVIYPEDSELVAGAVSDFAILLAKTERFESSAEVIEQYLADVPNPPKSAHAMLVATLGKAYVRMDRKAEARELLTTVINVQSGKDKDAIVENPSGLLAYSELGRLEFSENNWQAAADAFRNAATVATSLGLGDNFEVAEIRRQRATALQMLDSNDDAAAELREVARIYEVLGGGDSPQAKAVQEQLAAMEDSSPNQPSEEVTAALAALLNLTPDGEQMFRTKVENPIVAEPDPSSTTIGKIDPDKDVYSLQESNGFHRIYVPDAEQFGWVSEAGLQSRREYAIEKGKAKLKDELWFFQLTAAVKAFEEGMAVEDDDPQVEIEVLEKSLETIASKYQFSNQLSGLLSERLFAAHRKAGDFESPAALADKYLSPTLDAFGYKHPQTASLRLLRADVRRSVGDNRGAESALREAVDACEKCFGPNDPRTLMLSLRFAGAKVRIGYFDEAEEIYLRVADVKGADVGSVFLRSSAELGLGLLRACERNHTDAIRHLETAQDGFVSLGQPVPSLAVQGAMALAFSVFESGEAEEAISILDRVDDLTLQPSEAHIRVAYLSLKARLLSAINPKRAIEIADEAVQLDTEAHGKGSLLQLDAWSARGMAQAISGDVDGAAKSFRNSRQLAYVLGHFIVGYQSQNPQLSYAAEDARRLDDALRLAVETDSQAVVDASAEWLINGHALGTELQGRAPQVSVNLDLNSNSGLFLWEYLHRLAAQVPVRNLKKTGKAFTAKFEELKQQAAADRAKLPTEAQEALAATPDWTSLQTVRETLNENETLVMYRRLRSGTGYQNGASNQSPRAGQEAAYVAWVVPSIGNGDVAVIPIGDARQIDSLTAQLHKHLSQTADRAPSKGPLLTATSLELGLRRELGEKVWEPMASLLPEGCDSLTIVADGALPGVPWDALTLPGGASVFDRYTTRVVNNARDLLRTDPKLELSKAAMFVRPDRQDRRLDALPIFQSQRVAVEKRSGRGRPHFDKLDLQRAIPTRKAIVNTTFERFSDRSRGVPQADSNPNGLTAVQKTWMSLFQQDTDRFADGRCSQIGFYLKTRPAALHIEAAAFVRPWKSVPRTARFLSAEPRNLVSAFELAESVPFANCGLLVAGAAATGETSFIINDGIFTAEEIMGLDLRGTKIVTLSSAPRSIDGTADLGSDAALVSAFHIAGAKAVVSGLWPLDEHHADAVLQRFYLRLSEGCFYDEALRNAQQDMRKQNGRRVSAAFWASFRINGQNGRLVETKTPPRRRSTQVQRSTVSSEDELKKVAKKVLTTYRLKDVKALLSLSPDGPPSERVLKAFAPGSSRYESLFGDDSWRWQAVSEWEGNLPNVFYTQNRKPVSESQATAAHVEFGRNGTEIYVVTLMKTDDGWKFDDIHSPDASAFSGD